MVYAGIGSRKTPEDVLKNMNNMARFLAHAKHTLRSGGADGADKAFEEGASSIKDSPKEIYLPWQDYNGNKSRQWKPGKVAHNLAESFHPTWEKLSEGSQKLLARNSQIILGENLHKPCDFVVCWTPEGKINGGTGHTIRIAKHYKIPIFNFGNMSLQDMESKIMELI